MPVFSQASVLVRSESEVFPGTQATWAPRAQPSGFSSTDGRCFL